MCKDAAGVAAFLLSCKKVLRISYKTKRSARMRRQCCQLKKIGVCWVVCKDFNCDGILNSPFNYLSRTGKMIQNIQFSRFIRSQQWGKCFKSFKFPVWSLVNNGENDSNHSNSPSDYWSTTGKMIQIVQIPRIFISQWRGMPFKTLESPSRE